MNVYNRLAAFVVFMAASLVTANTMESNSSISFKKFPAGGQEAFWAHNPKNLDQKILLVPSCHIISLDYSRNDLQEVMKNGDVLISEGATGFETYEDMFRETLLFDCEDLRRCNIIKEGNFSINSKPWPEIMKIQFKGKLGKVAEFLESHLKCSMNDINPVFVTMLAKLFFANRQRPFGMDSQITNDYKQKGKDILRLEDRVSKLPSRDELLGQLTEIEDVINFKIPNVISNKDINNFFGTIYQLSAICHHLNHYLDLSDQKKHEESVEFSEQLLKKTNLNYCLIEEVERQCAKDNVSWLLKLLEAFETYHQKSIVVVIGAAHFPGLNTGMLKLLSDKGFTFTPF